MQPLADILTNALARGDAEPTGLCVAFSGGRDSSVLLHALHGLALPVPLRAIHIDHGLLAESAGWAAHCETVCRQWQIPMQVTRVDVSSAAADGGLEAAARDARYAVFRAELRPGEFLLTAHHSDDQLETVLLRLMRGSGPAGVAGIRPFAPFGPGYLVRPLLQAGRAQLFDYARQHALNWVEDPSNRDEGRDRNFLRHRVLPLLRERWPAAPDTVTRTARLADEAVHLLDELAELDAGAVVDGDTLHLGLLRELSARRQRNLLRWFLHRHEVPPPSAAALHDGLRQLCEARADSAPRLSWSAGELRRYRDRLYLLKCHPDSEPVPESRRWDGQAPLELGSLAGQLALRQGIGGTPDVGGQALTVRFRRGGERLLQHGQHVSLKSLYQSGGIVPWMRPHVPLVFHGDELLTVGGLWYAENPPGSGVATGLEVAWTPRERLR